MIKNYLRIAWRNFLRNKTFSFINIAGLSTGIAACFMLFLYVEHELTYDRYHVNADRIARVTTLLHSPESDMHFATSPILLADAVQKEYPEAEKAVRLQPGQVVIDHKNELIRETGFFRADQQVFEVFSFSFLEGSAAGALAQPNSVVLTASTAKKYFGIGQAVGKTLICDGQPVQVTAVIAHRPANSDLKIDALLSVDFSKTTAWLDGDFTVYTFVLFKSNPDLKRFEQKLSQMAARHIQPELDAAGAKDYSVAFACEPLTDVHFSKGKLVDTPKGNKQFNYIFSLLAFFILTIALFNYINLSTAKATERAKEVGVRKVNGAGKGELMRQFLFESFLLITVAWVIAILLVGTLLPLVNELLQTTLTVAWMPVAAFMASTFAVTILLAGLYPAFVLSTFPAIEVLKGKWRHSPKGIWLRKTLTVAQFAITAALITGMLVIYYQVNYIKHKDLGFVKDEVVTLFVPLDDESQKKVPSFANELKQQAQVRQVSVGYGMRYEALPMANTMVETETGNRELMCNYSFIDEQFLPMMGIRLKEGRNLSSAIVTDSAEAMLVNEAFVEKMGWKSAIGKSVEGFGRKARVVGVVKNFYYKSLHNVVEPLILVHHSPVVSSVLIKSGARDLASVKDVWKRFFPSSPFAFEFLDESYAAQYRKDNLTMTLFGLFTLLAIVISCLGLYGLVSLMSAQRTKEVGIRKVLGASLRHLLSMLTTGYLKLIVLAAAIALPAAGLVMHRWLSDYAYHVNLQWWMFLLPVVVMVVIALAITAGQVLKAARANPVQALRSE